MSGEEKLWENRGKGDKRGWWGVSRSRSVHVPSCACDSHHSLSCLLVKLCFGWFSWVRAPCPICLGVGGLCSLLLWDWECRTGTRETWAVKGVGAHVDSIFCICLQVGLCHQVPWDCRCGDLHAQVPVTWDTGSSYWID